MAGCDGIGLLDDVAWSGNIFAGSWRRGLGGTADSVEPVTGDVLGTYGVADEQDVATGARLATGPHARPSIGPRSFIGPLNCFRSTQTRSSSGLLENLGLRGRRVLSRCTPRLRSVRRQQASPLHLTGNCCVHPNRGSASSVGYRWEWWPSSRPTTSRSCCRCVPSLRHWLLETRCSSSRTPRTTVCGDVILAAILDKAGLPVGLFQVLPGGVDVGAALIAHPAVGWSPSQGRLQLVVQSAPIRLIRSLDTPRAWRKQRTDGPRRR